MDAGIVRQDSPRAAQPQAILKIRPPSSLDYKARHGPQTLKRGYLHLMFSMATLDYQINVAYEINVVLGIWVEMNKRSLWNKHSLVIFD